MTFAIAGRRVRLVRLVTIAAVAALALSGCGKQADGTATATAAPGEAATIAPPAGTTWADTVAKTPEGGFRMGNPDAPVKLVEYGSLTCSHCAAFAAEGLPELTAGFIKTGKVSYELRNFVRDPYDVVAALLTRCRGAEPFFTLTEQVFADQHDMFDRAGKLTPADNARIQALPQQQQFPAIADAVGYAQFFKVRGLPGAQVQACLTDQKALDELTKVNDVATKQYNVQGTPTFLINGEVVPDTADWAKLKPKLVTATGG